MLKVPMKRTSVESGGETLRFLRPFISPLCFQPFEPAFLWLVFSSIRSDHSSLRCHIGTIGLPSQAANERDDGQLQNDPSPKAFLTVIRAVIASHIVDRNVFSRHGISPASSSGQLRVIHFCL